ncbi:MAG: endonuclease MutS2 [Nitrospirota bacterium]
MDGQTPFRQAERVLEWDRVLEILAGQARSTMGIERCRSLPPEAGLDAATSRLRETAEMLALGEGTDPFPSPAFPDVREALGRAAKGASLEAHDLRDLSILLGVGRQVVRYLRARAEQAPALCAAASGVEGLGQLESLRDAIDQCVDQEGNVRESATPDLRRLTRHAQDLKQQMRHRLEAILASARYAEVLQERYFAQREGRYVVPVKSEMRTKIPGIVHDVSASGATVFFEPRELVELNNGIKVAELDVEREVKRILADLSVQVAAHGLALKLGAEGLAELDCIAAKAAFGRLVNGRVVALNGVGRVALRQARHPLLVLARERVVANDILLDESVRVLIVSGPNTGGKTVTLKLLGLFALMVRAGLPVPCGADSVMAFFPEVYADIGDAQDLTRDLSSFSAHVTQMIRLLEHAASASRPRGAGEAPSGGSGALVLLDEPVTSTDPAEGAALAEALLLRLASLGMKVIVTTHYNRLKVLAQTTPGFLNACVEFDVARLAPTYRLLMNLPGGSSAIEIAGRLGMDEELLAHARGLLRREDQTLERMLTDLHDRQRRLDEDLERTAALREEAERSAREAEAIAERLRRSEQEERKGAKRKLTETLLHARAQVQAALDELKHERTQARARETKQRLAEIGERARQLLVKPAETVPVERLRPGDRVEIVGLGTVGTLLEAPQGRKRVRIRIGETEMSVAPSGLVGLAGKGAEPQRSSGRPAPARHGQGSSADSEAAGVVDLRGMAADEAVEAVTASLDRAALNGEPFLRIIHGHGTGRLKTAVREYLTHSPYVASFRPGDRSEGGDGVTVAELK